MNELTPEIKFNKRTKIALVALTALIVGPLSFYLALSILGITAAIGAAALAVLVVAFINAMIPAVSDWLTVKKFKAVKAVAAANPVETLEREQAEAKADLDQARTGIEESIESVELMAEQVNEIKRDPAARPDQVEAWLGRLEEYEKLLAYRVDLYKTAVAAYRNFDGVIRVARVEWRLMQTDAKLSKTFQRKDEFMRKLRTSTALDTIQQASARSRAALKMAIIDGEGTLQNIKDAPAVHAIKYDASGKVVLGNILDVEAVPVSKGNQ